jgi:hypothetical protein
MIMKDKPTYTLWHMGDLMATGPHTRETFMAFIEEGRQMVEDCAAGGVRHGAAEIFSSRDDSVWTFDQQDLKQLERDLAAANELESQPYDGWEGSWAGDGSGMDDLADFNSMEGYDY